MRRYAISVFSESWRSSAAAVTRSKADPHPCSPLPFLSAYDASTGALSPHRSRSLLRGWDSVLRRGSERAAIAVVKLQSSQASLSFPEPRLLHRENAAATLQAD